MLLTTLSDAFWVLILSNKCGNDENKHHKLKPNSTSTTKSLALPPSCFPSSACWGFTWHYVCLLLFSHHYLFISQVAPVWISQIFSKPFKACGQRNPPLKPTQLSFLAGALHLSLSSFLPPSDPSRWESRRPLQSLSRGPHCPGSDSVWLVVSPLEPEPELERPTAPELQ